MSKLEKCHQDAKDNRDQIIAKSSSKMAARFKKFEANSHALRDERINLQSEAKLSTKGHFASETEERQVNWSLVFIPDRYFRKTQANDDLKFLADGNRCSLDVYVSIELFILLMDV